MSELPPDMAIMTMSSLVLGAGYGVDILGPSIFVEAGLPIADMALMTDSRLPRRALEHSRELQRPVPEEYCEVLGEVEESTLKGLFSGLGWELRRLDSAPKLGCLLVDGEFGCVLGLPEGSVGPRALFVEGTEEVRPYQTYFDRRWGSLGPYELLYDAFLDPAFPERETQVVQASRRIWEDLVRYFAEHPEALRETEPRTLEELVRELLDREGMDAKLTPKTRDGGFDVLAFARTAFGPELLYLVECKRYAAGRPVGVEVVRSLYGVVEREKANAGIIVTTSSFTKGALRFQQDVRHRLGLKDYHDLVAWLRLHTGG